MKINKKGFTLIELLIVVAIIAILAAIAIPQFSAYRVRGFNAAASSDLRNVATSQEALFSDTNGYGASVAGALLGIGIPVLTSPILTGPFVPSNAVAVVGASVQLRNNLGAVGCSISNNVMFGTKSSTLSANNTLTDYVMATKNLQGDTCFARDSDSTSMYRALGSVTAAGLIAANIPAATINNDNLNGVAGGAGCAANYGAI